MNRFRSSAILVCAVASAIPGIALAQSAQRQFSVPAQPLSRALTQLSTQAGVDILFQGNDVGGMQAPALQGRMSAVEAVRRLIAGKALKVTTTRSGSLIIRPTERPNRPRRDEARSRPEPVEMSAAQDQSDIVVTGYRVGETAGGTRIMTAVKDLPMSVEIVNRELIEDLGARKIEDAIRYVSGINKVNRNDNLARGERFAIRGFNSSLIMRNGVPYNVFSDTANIQQIDVVKGANSILYGFNDPGGLINFITKAPQDKPGYNVSQTVGTYRYYRTEADLTGPLFGDTNYRLVGAYTNAGSWLANGKDETIFVNPVVDIGLTDKTRLVFDYEYRRQNSRGLREGYPLLFDAKNVAYAYPDLGSRYSPIFPQNRNINRVQNFEARLTHSFTPTTVLRLVAAHTDINSDQFNAFSGNILPGSLTQTRTRVYLEQNRQKTDFLFADFSTQFSFLGMKHKLILGGQHLERSGEGYGKFSDYGPVWDIRTNDYAIHYAIPATRADLMRAVKLTNIAPTKSSGAYIIDQISLLDDRLHVLAGGRYDRLNGVNRFTPQIGGNYRVNHWLSAYALYSESFRLNAPYTYLDTGEVVTFPPEVGQNREFGFKLDLLDHRLSSTIAFFSLKRKNVLQATASQDPLRPHLNLSGGERSRGVEFDVSGKIGRSLSIFGSYAHTDTKVLSSSNAATIGAPLEGVARNAASLFAKYDLGEVGPGRLSFNAGTLWREGPILLLNNIPANSRIHQDSYIVFDGGIDYDLPGDLTLSIKGTNLGDKAYMDRRSAYAAPREISFTIRKAF